MELPTLSRNSATVVNVGNGRSNCCWANVAAPSDEDAGICPKYGLVTRVNSAGPMERYCEGSWLILKSGIPRRVFFEPRYAASTFQSLPMVF